MTSAEGFPTIPRSRAPAAAIALLAICGFALELAAFWPGLMSIDSVVQYAEAVTGRYADPHPPVMAWLWSLTNRVVPGPAGMLIVHLALLWIGLAAIAEGARRRGTALAWAVPLVGVLPFVASIAGVVWKDIGMAYALLCAGGLLFVSPLCRRGACRFPLYALAAVLLAYATMVRDNAPAASVALVAYAIVTLRPRTRVALAGTAAVGIVVAIAVLQLVATRTLLHATPRYLSQYLMLFDVVGIRCRGGDVDIPMAFRSSDYEQAAVCRAFTPYQVDTLFFFPHSPLQSSVDPDAVRALRGAWTGAIVDHPLAYAAHRAEVFAGLLGLRAMPSAFRYLSQPYMQWNPWGFSFAPNPLSRALAATVDALAATPLFSGALWLALAAGLLIVLVLRRVDAPFEVALLVSALLYALPYAVLSIAANYRYLYWSVVSTAVASLLLAIRAIAQRNSRRRVSTSAT